MFVDWQASVPPEALGSWWTEEQRIAAGIKLNTASSAEDLLQVYLSSLKDNSSCVRGFLFFIEKSAAFSAECGK